ncbi:hypothetical protein ACWGDX_08010 [Streptomyces sp. NPDC055025]
MKQFVFQHAQDVWPEGETLLHVYIFPHEQDRELTALVTRCRFAFQVSLSHWRWPLSGPKDSTVRRTAVLSH